MFLLLNSSTLEHTLAKRILFQLDELAIYAVHITLFNKSIVVYLCNYLIAYTMGTKSDCLYYVSSCFLFISSELSC